VPKGVEPSAVVVSSGGDKWLVVIGGRNGLFAWYTPANLPAAGGALPVWGEFNIAEHHNTVFGGTPLAFSDDMVAGTGGGDESTGYMGSTLSRAGDKVLVCYDRTVSHMSVGVEEATRSSGSIPYNSIYCFSLQPPPI